MATAEKCKTCDHFFPGRCAAPVPFWAEPHNRPRVYSEDGSGCPSHSDRSAAPDLLAALAKAAEYENRDAFYTERQVAPWYEAAVLAIAKVEGRE